MKRTHKPRPSHVSDPADHPVLRIIGLADGVTVEPPAYDVAREHDRFLAESEADSWTRRAKPAKKRRC